MALGAGGCGGGDGPAPTPSGGPPAAPAKAGATQAAAAAASLTAPPRCRKVPRGTLRLIASHADVRTRFSIGSAAAVDAGRGYAVSVATLAGGTRRVGTWLVDDLRAPRSVTSGNTQALEVTNWPLDALDAAPAGQSRNCVTQNLRGPGPVP